VVVVNHHLKYLFLDEPLPEGKVRLKYRRPIISDINIKNIIQRDFTAADKNTFDYYLYYFLIAILRV